MSNEKPPTKAESERLEALRLRRIVLGSLNHKSIKAEDAEANPDDRSTLEAREILLGRYEDTEKARQERAQTDSLIERNHDASADRKLRQKYALWVYSYLVGYSIFVGIVLMLSAWKVCGFHLDSEVLSYLVGSTAAAAVGLVYAVTHGLFSNKK